MTTFEDNIYYNPEKSGLTLLETIDKSDGSYQFDYFCLWRFKDGRLFYGTDSGCSCPSPFENVNTLDALTEVPSFAQLKNALEEWLGAETEWDGQWLRARGGANELVQKMRGHL